jgi:hypothetical protein
VKEGEYENLWKMYAIQAGMLCVPFFFLWLLIKKKEVELVQLMVHHADHAGMSEHGLPEHLDLNHVVEVLKESETQAGRNAINDLHALVRADHHLLKDAHLTEEQIQERHEKQSALFIAAIQEEVNEHD